MDGGKFFFFLAHHYFSQRADGGGGGQTREEAEESGQSQEGRATACQSSCRCKDFKKILAALPIVNRQLESIVVATDK